MNKSFYTSAIFILSISIAAGLLQGIIYLMLGGQMIMMESFWGWFLISNAIALTGSCLVLKYFYYKKYRFAFIFGVVSTIITLGQGILFYVVLGTARWQGLYIPFVLLSVGTGIVHALILIFSTASERPLLKTTGVLMLVFGVLLAAALIGTLSSQDGGVRTTFDNVIQWTLLAESLIPVLLILNFSSEIRALSSSNADGPLRRSSESLRGVAGMGILFLSITFGVVLARDTGESLYWKKQNAEKANAFAQLCESRSFTNREGQTLTYLLMKPIDYDPRQKYPLVVALPYGGYEAPPAQELASNINRRKYPAFIFVPNCPPGEGWGGIPNYPTIDTLVFDAILAMEEDVSIDATRRYVTGVSRGGYGSWHFISARPEMFAAAVPVCGGGDPSQAAKMVDVAVWAFHGAKDKNVPVSGSRDMIEAIKKAGGNPQYTEYESEAHSIWHRVSQTSGLWDWLFEQRRD